MKAKKTYIQKLFDNINGGDDVDSAAIAQEIAEDLLERLKAFHKYPCNNYCIHCDTCGIIEKAEGK